MDLALNNLKRVDMPLNKETKPNIYLDEKKIAAYHIVLQISFVTEGNHCTSLLTSLLDPLYFFPKM